MIFLVVTGDSTLRAMIVVANVPLKRQVQPPRFSCGWSSVKHGSVPISSGVPPGKVLGAASIAAGSVTKRREVGVPVKT